MPSVSRFASRYSSTRLAYAPDVALSTAPVYSSEMRMRSWRMPSSPIKSGLNFVTAMRPAVNAIIPGTITNPVSLEWRSVVHCSVSRYPARNRWSQRASLMTLLRRIITMANAGTTVRLISSDASLVTAIVIPTSPSHTASSSPRVTMTGANTMIVVSVDAVIASATSFVPRNEAATGLAPWILR